MHWPSVSGFMLIPFLASIEAISTVASSMLDRVKHSSIILSDHAYQGFNSCEFTVVGSVDLWPLY